MECIFVHQQWNMRNRNQGGKSHLLQQQQKINYLRINLTKDIIDVYSENYTTLKKEIKEDTNKWSIYHIHGLEELTSSKCPYYPKQFFFTWNTLYWIRILYSAVFSPRSNSDLVLLWYFAVLHHLLIISLKPAFIFPIIPRTMKGIILGNVFPNYLSKHNMIPT